MRRAATWSSHRVRQRTRATSSKYRFRRSVFAFRRAIAAQPKLKRNFNAKQAGVDDRAVVGGAARHCGPDEEARLDGLGVAVEVAAVIGVQEDVGAALQFGIDAARLFELEAAGAGTGDCRASDAVARQQIAGPSGLFG